MVHGGPWPAQCIRGSKSSAKSWLNSIIRISRISWTAVPCRTERPTSSWNTSTASRSTLYCDSNRLDIAARLKLFQTVCAAVHYAHQNLIVHRDLKPSNILVTAAGVPKAARFRHCQIIGRTPGGASHAGGDAGRLSPHDAGSCESRAGPRAGHHHLERCLRPGRAAVQIADRYRPLRHSVHAPHGYRARHLREGSAAAQSAVDTDDSAEIRSIAEARGATAKRLRRTLARRSGQHRIHGDAQGTRTPLCVVAANGRATSSGIWTANPS